MKFAVKLTEKQWGDLCRLLREISLYKGDKIPAKWQLKCDKYWEKLFYPVFDTAGILQSAAKKSVKKKAKKKIAKKVKKHG